MEKIYCTVHIETGQKSSMVAPSTAENTAKSMKVGGIGNLYLYPHFSIN